MASNVGQISFSEELQDAVVALDRAITAQLQFLDDTAQFFIARAQLHKEQSKGLRSIVKRAQERRSAHLPALVVGENPTRAFSEELAQRHSLDRAWSVLLAETDEEAQDQGNMANAVEQEIAEALQAAERKKNDLRKRQLAFHESLVAERDAWNAKRTKAKAQYDYACGEVESARAKSDGAKDADKASRHLAKAMSAMAVAKNNYLVATEAYNAVKANYFRTALPTLHEHAQSIMTLTVRRWMTILERNGVIHASHSSNLAQRTSRVVAAVRAVDIAADQAIFVEANKRQTFAEPADGASSTNLLN